MSIVNDTTILLLLCQMRRQLEDIDNNITTLEEEIKEGINERYRAANKMGRLSVVERA